MNKLLILLLSILTFTAFSCKDTTTTSDSANKEMNKASVNASQNSPSAKISANSSNKSVKVRTEAKAGEMHWYGMDEVEELVADSPKKIIVDVYTQWCGPCKMMDRNTFSNAEVQEAINEKFYPVKFDAEGAEDINFRGQVYSNPNHDPNRRGRNASHQLSKFFSVRGYPTLVVLDENFNILHKIVGYKQPQQLLDAIEAI